MDDINVAANAPEVAAPEIEVTSESNPGEVQPEVKQEVTETQAFAKRLKEATTKAEQTAMDKVIAEIYGESHGFKTYSEYQKAVAEYQRQQQIQQEAEQYQTDPKLIERIRQAEEKVANAEKLLTEKEQAAENAKLQEEITKQVNDVLEQAKKDGMELTEEQLLQAAIDNGLTDMKKVYKLLKPEPDISKLKEQAVKEYIEKLTKGRVPIEGGGAAPAIVSETPKNFDDARKGAAAILRAANMFK